MHRPILATIVAAALLLLRAGEVHAGKSTCLTGSDPDVAGDAAAIRALRPQIDEACRCASFDGSKGKTHAAFVKCAVGVINGAIKNGDLRKQCKGTINSYFAKSTCGQPPYLHRVVCIKKVLTRDKVTCSIQSTTKKNGTPKNQCVGKAGKFAEVPCPDWALCVDAADSNDDLIIAAPGDTGQCNPTPTPSPTVPTPTPTVTPVSTPSPTPTAAGDGPAIDAPTQTWTWVDFPDSACSDGSATGIGVNLTNSQNVLVVFNGGGACWDYLTCYTLMTATNGPYDQTEFAADSQTFANTILDRQLSGNPFAGWNLVFIPYCTGDMHAGDNIATYQSGQTSRMYHHVGHDNVLAYLHRLGPTFPSVARMVVAGESAGGFGALFNYATFRNRWSSGELYLLDDSGPILWDPLESTCRHASLSIL